MISDLLSRFAASCDLQPGFFDFPTWYKYLEKQTIDNQCEIVNFGIEDIPLVGLALVDIALRIAALIAVGYVVYGGVQFVTSQGEADKSKKARQTIINALIGLVIALLSAAIVAFIGRRIGN